MEATLSKYDNLFLMAVVSNLHILPVYSSSPVRALKETLGQSGGPISMKAKEMWEEILKTQNQVDNTLDNFDDNLSQVLKKHEYEYMLAYNYYVKKKELEIRDAINQLGNNSNSEIKDLKI